MASNGNGTGRDLITSQPLKWHGGKSGLAEWIHAHAPPSIIENFAHGYSHRNIVFAGGMAEFWNWLPIEGISETVNDLNGELTNFYRVLQDEAMVEQFCRMCEATPFSDVEFQRAKTGAGFVDPVRRAWAFFVRFRQSRQGLGRDYATPTRRTRRKRNENVSAWTTCVDGLREFHERLRRVEIRNIDGREFIRKYDHTKSFFYLDPPYLPETRSGGGEYGEFEMTREQHILLLEQLRSVEGKFMLSGYRSELYDSYADVYGWIRHERIIDNKASSKKVKDQRVECLWTNYAK